jgi:hypothetical protein
MHVVLNESFASKEALETHVRNLLKNNRGFIPANHALFPFLVALLERHPKRDEKIGPGVKAFTIGVAPGSEGRGSTLFVHRPGARIHVSWKMCCQARGKTERAIEVFAYRRAIDSQVREYGMANQSNQCNSCKGFFPQTHIDHIKPFSKLMSDFKEKYPEGTKNAWKRYHAKHATYQRLCATCNVRKGNSE